LIAAFIENANRQTTITNMPQQITPIGFKPGNLVVLKRPANDPRCSSPPRNRGQRPDSVFFGFQRVLDNEILRDKGEPIRVDNY